MLQRTVAETQRSVDVAKEKLRSVRAEQSRRVSGMTGSAPARVAGEADALSEGDGEPVSVCDVVDSE